MKFAYADPPYFTMGKKMYGKLHDEAHIWDRKEEHIKLIQRLVEEYPDGWALSCNPADLRWLLPSCPEEIRIAAWTKTFFQLRPACSVQYGWEPVIWFGGRKVTDREFVRDWMASPRNMATGVPGAKPLAFNRWVLDLLGYDAKEDTIDDIFPGSYGMTNAANEMRLL